MYDVILFILISVPILYISWPSLRNASSHGFYRFFAFETALLLGLLNLDVWFLDPLSLSQIASWVLLILSLFLAVHGFYMLKAIGKPSGKIEETTHLVTQGAYRYIRHPLYASLLYFGLGAFLKNPSWVGFGLLLGLLAFLTATARTEEIENLERFGEPYRDYIIRTKMFVPFLW